MNKVIIITAPSGSGKTTIVQHLLSVNENLKFSVSACTRKQRKDEVDGKDYYFLSHEAFQSHIKKGHFAEWEEVYKGAFYGTLKSEIDRIWKENKTVIFDIDVQGALNLKKTFGHDALAIFIKPPTKEEHERRLKHRNSETDETLKIRISKAQDEMKYADKFDTLVINDDLETAKNEAEHLVAGFLEK